MITHTKRGRNQDSRKRSSENWERGVGARKIGNPRYKPVRVKGKDNVVRKVYKVRKR